MDAHEHLPDDMAHTHDKITHSRESNISDVHKQEPGIGGTNEYESTHSHTHTHTHTKAVLNRLSRAIGHLTAVRGMVENGRDCAEVLIQLAAVRSAINGACEVILKDHLEHCIVDAINTDDMKAIDELKRAVELLMK